MNNTFLLIALSVTINCFFIQSTQPAGMQKKFHHATDIPSALSLELQLRLAELKLKKIDLEIAKGPTADRKNLFVPQLGMGIGSLCVLAASSGAILNKEVAGTNGASLLVGICVFAFSYWQYKSNDKKENEYLREKKEVQQDVVNFIKKKVKNKST